MNKADIQTLFDYNYWANHRLLAAVDQITDDEFNAVAPGLGHASIRSTLVHLMGAEQIWRQRCLEGISPTALLPVDQFLSVDALLQRWDQEEKLMREALARQTDESLAETFVYHTTKGLTMRDVRWQVLAHAVNHGTQHRSEAAVALTALGHSPGDLDMIIYLREKGQA